MHKIKQELKRLLESKLIIYIYNKLFLSMKGSAYNRCMIETLLYKSSINIRGKYNDIEIGKSKGLNRINIYINGSHNSIVVENDIYAKDLNIWIEDNNNTVYIEKESVFTGRVQLSAIEGTKIVISSKCLFSDSIDIRTGDAHSIIGIEGKRLNNSKDVSVGYHCWIGKNVSILKGVNIGKNSVIGTGSIVTKPFNEESVIVAGNPARVVKRNINWEFER